mmetsp:Transcript_7615/g.15395  ORF Transcript_7615/g.15395 Transcript_7615/m.15395 type:complete len:239 (-) Transcript_7615:175-891(-)
MLPWRSSSVSVEFCTSASPRGRTPSSPIRLTRRIKRWRGVFAAMAWAMISAPPSEMPLEPKSSDRKPALPRTPSTRYLAPSSPTSFNPRPKVRNDVFSHKALPKCLAPSGPMRLSRSKSFSIVLQPLSHKPKALAPASPMSLDSKFSSRNVGCEAKASAMAMAPMSEASLFLSRNAKRPRFVARPRAKTSQPSPPMKEHSRSNLPAAWLLAMSRPSCFNPELEMLQMYESSSSPSVSS